jgi:DNA-binding transcriptional MerR regulator
MPYTVNKLAKLSGVSVRTLHYYDEIGMLKPAFYGENNYRYYEEKQLLLLQQILFYKELGLPLNDIQNMLANEDFDKVAALESHKQVLNNDLDKTKNLIKTIDKTIAHLKGNVTMKIEEIFIGFTPEKQKLYENFLVENGVDQAQIADTKNKIKNWATDAWLENKAEADKIHANLVALIQQKIQPASTKVQPLIRQHYELTKTFWTPNRESYIALSKLYASHPDFIKFYADIHPNLLNYLLEAMKIFAEKELS